MYTSNSIFPCIPGLLFLRIYISFGLKLIWPEWHCGMRFNMLVWYLLISRQMPKLAIRTKSVTHSFKCIYNTNFLLFCVCFGAFWQINISNSVCSVHLLILCKNICMCRCSPLATADVVSRAFVNMYVVCEAPWEWSKLSVVLPPFFLSLPLSYPQSSSHIP